MSEIVYSYESKAKYHLVLNSTTRPINKISYIERRYLYRHRKQEAYLTGESFEVGYSLRNTGTENFPGGRLIIDIKWPNGIPESIQFPISQLSPNETVNIPSKEWGILDVGHALFSARMFLPEVPMHATQPRKYRIISVAPLFNEDGNEILLNTAFFSIYSQTKDEYYQYWAMITSAIALFLIVLKDVFLPFILWLIERFYPLYLISAY